MVTTKHTSAAPSGPAVSKRPMPQAEATSPMPGPMTLSPR